MSNVIVLYDITSGIPGKWWSPNVAKIRYVLNIKKLAHRTEWVELPDIATLNQKIGAKPTGKNPDGTDYYSLPAIHDPSTDTTLSESIEIAMYLENAYPNTPTVFPHGSAALHAAFADTFMGKIMPVLGIVWLELYDAQTERGKAHVRRTKEALLKTSMDEWAPFGSEKRKGLWAGFKAGLDSVDGWLSKSGSEYAMGDSLTYADFHAVARVAWVKRLMGEDSQEWKELSTWNNGRWSRLLEDVQPYTTVHE